MRALMCVVAVVGVAGCKQPQSCAGACCSEVSLESAGECVPTQSDYEGPWQIDTVSWDCDTTTGDYTYSVLTDGWANTLTLDIFETGSWDGSNEATVWDEQHPMDNTEYADDGSWDQWDLTLDPAVDSNGDPDTTAQVAGETTLWTCGTHGDAELAWMATMDAVDDSADCAIWGHEAVEWFNTAQGHSCVDLSP